MSTQVTYQPRPEDIRFVRGSGDLAEIEAEREAITRDRDRAMVRLRDDLVAVVAKIGQPIVIPEGPLTIEQLRTIADLRSILRTGGVIQTWDQVDFPLSLTQVRGLLDLHGAGYFSLAIEGGTSRPFELFGAALPLGPVRMLFRQTRIADVVAVREVLATATDYHLPIVVRFGPGPDDNTVEIRFPEWGPNPTSVGSRGRLDAAERLTLLPAVKSRRMHHLFEERQRRALTTAESRELTVLVGEHGRSLLERNISLFGGLEGIESNEAHRLFQAEFAATTARWEALRSDQGRLEALVAKAREQRPPSDG